jgi:nickel-dependent lactate racemase
MPEIRLPFGHGEIAATVAPADLLGVYTIAETEETGDAETLLRAALERPVGSPRLRDLARPGQRIAIIASDLTRPCPSALLLPPVLEELRAAGVADADIVIIAALGLHRPMTEAELREMAGPAVFERYRVINHDPADTVRLGVTARGTPAEIFRPAVAADLRVCLGNLEFHYFAGYSGGAKAILPGCASRAAVNANHAMMVQPEAAAGRLAGNPVRADLEEGAALAGPAFMLNVLIGAEHQIVAAVAGDLTAAHRRGCEWVAQRGMLPVARLADIVLVSAGGFPKDVNLYQAQKALDNAVYAVRTGGVIILVAECREGFGNATFQRWLCTAESPDQLLAWIQQEFVLGGHKAAAIAAVQKKAEVFLVSSLPAEEARRAGLHPCASVEEALEAARRRVGPAAGVAVIPQGGSVLPALKE